MTLACCAMGCGILSLPRVFAMCGPLSSLAFLGLFASWVDASLRWMVACGRYSGLDNFEGNVRFFVGPVAAKVVRLGQVMLTFGGVVAVLMTVASLMRCVATDLVAAACEESAVDLDAAGEPAIGAVSSPSVHALMDELCVMHPLPCMPKGRVTLIVTVAVFPLACQKSLHSLRSFSVLSLACFAHFFLALVLHTARAVANSVMFEGSEFVRLRHTAQRDVSEVGEFWQGPPILLMSLLCHGSILRLDRELRPDARSQVACIIHRVIFGIALPVYALVGISGYWLYGTAVSANVLEDFAGYPSMSIARIALSLTNLIKIPLAVVTLREDFASSAPQPWLRDALSNRTGRLASSAIVLGAAAIAATCAGSLARVLSLLGCLVGVPFSLCVPALLYWRLICRLDGRKPINGLSEPFLKRTPRGEIDGLPLDPVSKRRHQAHTLLVLFGGALVGALGLISWLTELEH